MLFKAAKLIGIRGYYRMHKADLVEELYAIHRDPQRVPRTLTRVYYMKTPNPDMEAIPRRRIKRCIHGRQSNICKECKELGVVGEGICEHIRKRYHCKECKALGVGGTGICEHDRQKYKCIDCRGRGICEHGIQKYVCKDCGEGGICEAHGISLNSCKLCNTLLFVRNICYHGIAFENCDQCQR